MKKLRLRRTDGTFENENLHRSRRSGPVLVNCGQGRNKDVNRSTKQDIREVKTLTPDERRELIDRLAHDEENSRDQIVRRPGTLKGTVKYMAPDFDAPLEDFREYMG